jgi:hypothetical protein
VFLSSQQPDGFISRTVGITYPKPYQMFKPSLAQLAILGSQQTGSYEWPRKEDYGKLQRYVDHRFGYDTDHNGLPTWNSSDASGMDNQYSRSGDLDSYYDEGVDPACFRLREPQAMAIISKQLGKLQEQHEYEDRAQRLSKLINDVFRDEKDGFYYDRNEKTGKLQPFFRKTAFNASRSRLRSATSCFSRRFSSSTCRSRCASLTSSPPYFNFQL